MRKKQQKLEVIYFTLFFLQYFDLTLGYVLDPLYSVWLLQMSDKPDAETSTWQHTTLTRENHVSHRIRTHIPSKQVATP
jgi:hypothetical protein